MNEHTTASEVPNTQEEEKKGSIIRGTILLVLAYGLFGFSVFWTMMYMIFFLPEMGMYTPYSLLIICAFVLSIVLFILALRQFYRRIHQLSAEGNSTRYTLATVFTIVIIVAPVLGVYFFPTLARIYL